MVRLIGQRPEAETQATDEWGMAAIFRVYLFAMNR
jgi:hypothetical protein